MSDIEEFCPKDSNHWREWLEENHQQKRGRLARFLQETRQKRILEIALHASKGRKPKQFR